MILGGTVVSTIGIIYYEDFISYSLFVFLWKKKNQKKPPEKDYTAFSGWYPD